MPLLTPHSWGARNRPARYLFEFNPNHVPAGSPTGGQFTTGKGGTSTTAGPTSYKGGERKPRGIPIRTNNLDQAVRLILKGHVVELTDTKQVHTVIAKLADMALEAAKLQKAAPNYDLCQVTVPGTNLFCNAIVQNEKHPNGILRDGMPQLGGVPIPGSAADKLPKDKDGKVDGSDEFIKYLESRGYKVERNVTIPAAHLKASQKEMIGPHVGQMMVDERFDPGKKPIFVSRDNYVVDGHHRWAAVVGRDTRDGVLGDHPMNTIRVDAPISELLEIANEWSLKFGIKPVGGVRRSRAS